MSLRVQGTPAAPGWHDLQRLDSDPWPNGQGNAVLHFYLNPSETVAVIPGLIRTTHTQRPIAPELIRRAGQRDKMKSILALATLPALALAVGEPQWCRIHDTDWVRYRTCPCIHNKCGVMGQYPEGERVWIVAQMQGTKWDGYVLPLQSSPTVPTCKADPCPKNRLVGTDG